MWKIDVDHGARNLLSAGNPVGRDRGGQTVEQEESTQKDQRVKATPGIRKIPLGIRIKILSQIKKSEKSQNVKNGLLRDRRKERKVQEKTAPEVQDNENKLKNVWMGRNAKSYDKGDLVFAAIGILLILEQHCSSAEIFP